MLVAKDITKVYGARQVLNGLDLTVQKGEIISIVGASGAGKSTLLHILGTLDVPDGGSVHLEGVCISGLEDSALARLRNEKIGFVFQFHNLLPEFTALENVCMPALIHGLSMSEASQRAQELMEMLDLSGCMHRKPSEMSGGEQQRTAVARALVNRPLIVFADEPSGNLDSKNADMLHALFFSLREKLGQTFVIVTHNKEFAAMADRCIELSDGKIKQIYAS